MKRKGMLPVLAMLVAGLSAASLTVGCGGAPVQEETQVTQEETQVSQEVASGQTAETPANGTYDIVAETDSSMFRADSCTLTVADGSCTATLVLPGEGFSRLYFGAAEDAASAPDADIYDYHLNDEGKYAFDIPVEALDEELQVAAYGQRRDTWYDHTIVFHAPEGDALSDAA